jgi:sulfide dehydrogenase [flavocytochrome c] flavoprotein chain
VNYKPGKMRSTRRDLMFGMGAGIFAVSGFAVPSYSTSRPKLVVIGAGPGGAITANLLATIAPGRFEITLVEAAPRYLTPFLSNSALAHLRPIESVIHDYNTLGDRVDIKIVNDRVVAIDRSTRVVRLAGGMDLAYDRLVAAPGVSFRGERIEGYDDQTMPHAWGGEAQLRNLFGRLSDMEDGGVFAIATPPHPHRCSVAAYERATQVAGYFKAKKPNSKILILDANPNFVMQGLFENAWADNFDEMIEWIPPDMHGGVDRVDAKLMTISTDIEEFEVNVANVIPPQTAARFLIDAGLAGKNGYCPISGQTMASLSDPYIHIVGDSADSVVMSRSASSAAVQAVIAAGSILRELLNKTIPETELVATCWAILGDSDAIKLKERYKVEDDVIGIAEREVSNVDDTVAIRQAEAAGVKAWYEKMIAKMYLDGNYDLRAE